MSVAFKSGQSTGPDDLKIEIRNSVGQLTDPFEITYSIFDFTTGVEVLIGAPNQDPQSASVGMFYAAFTVPLDANIGDWVVRWNFRESPTSSIIQAVQEFNVIGTDTVSSIGVNTVEQLLIRRLRISLRDNNPDRNYSFRPPSTEKFIQSQTEVFGYLWTDEELLEYLLMAIDAFNGAPPVTDVDMTSLPDRWRTVVIMGAGAQACRSMALNWIVNEFSIKGDEKLSLLVDEEKISMTIEEFFDIIYSSQKEEHKQMLKDEGFDEAT